jgi:hypothetical protein
MYHVFRCASNPVYKTRVMAARAIRPLVSTEHFLVIITMLLDNMRVFKNTENVSKDWQNLVHGSLLQVEFCNLFCALPKCE